MDTCWQNWDSTTRQYRTHKQIQTLENHWPITDTEINKANFSTLEVIMLDLLATWARVEGSPAAPVSPLCLSRLDALLSPCSVGSHILRAHHSIPAAQRHCTNTQYSYEHHHITYIKYRMLPPVLSNRFSHRCWLLTCKHHSCHPQNLWEIHCDLLVHILWANLHEAFIDVLILSRVLSFCSFFTFQPALILSKSILRWTILM